MLKRKYRVSEKVSGSPKVFKGWKDWKVGDTVIGVFKDTYIDKYKKTATVINVEETFFKGDKAEYAGKDLVLNSCGKLDKAVEKLQKGDLIQIEYKGKSMLETGPYAGKEAHDVQVDKIELVEDDSDLDETDDL
jgi:hypothetical protein